MRTHTFPLTPRASFFPGSASSCSSSSSSAFSHSSLALPHLPHHPSLPPPPLLLPHAEDLLFAPRHARLVFGAEERRGRGGSPRGSEAGSGSGVGLMCVDGRAGVGGVRISKHIRVVAMSGWVAVGGWPSGWVARAWSGSARSSSNPLMAGRVCQGLVSSAKVW